MEMLELERRGFELSIGSIHPPLTSLRHEHVNRIRSPIHYAPPQSILWLWERKAKESGRWPQSLIDAHEKRYGRPFKATLRARNASYFADLFAHQKIDHVHVHFANRAAHTALFLKQMSGIPFSVTAHGQDFMSDLGNDSLLQEICENAEFVAAETEYSRALLQARCPDSAEKIYRVYNGIDFTQFPERRAESSSGLVRIVSVGRLVEFKGFENLIDACALLRSKQLDFTCDIIGAGPLRDRLAAHIAELQLGNIVTLRGSLNQGQVFHELRSADIFVLPSIIDQAGASDVFPTVIQEAMASERPVVSTRLAGIPETVLNGETGLLVTPGDVEALANALEKLIHDGELRVRLGAAGRKRLERYFQIGTTIEPLMDLLRINSRSISSDPRSTTGSKGEKIAYLIDLWPDSQLPILETELLEMERRNLPVIAFVCRTPTNPRLNALMEKVGPSLEFLPDAMVIEAEWEANRELVGWLENDRANEKHRIPAELFLQQARFAIALQKSMRAKNISHVHVTNSRALVCGLLLRKIIGVTLSATIEARSILPRPVLYTVLKECVGGRTEDRQLSSAFGSPFFFDRSNTSASRTLRRIIGTDLIGHNDFWEEWARRLVLWGKTPISYPAPLSR